MLPRRPNSWLLIPPAAALLAYAALLTRGFTSEDFLLIRFLGEHPPWRDLAAQLTSPWLGISGIRFLRPLSTTLYAAEIALFGAHSAGYDCVHALVHAGNAWLVAAVLHRLLQHDAAARRPGAPAMAGALLFALHPLHPNAVIFSASFATLFGASFAFIALLSYLRWREEGGSCWWALSLASFGCGLLSYEAAAVLVLWLAAADHLCPAAVPARSHLRRVAGWAPFAGLLAVYLGWRVWVFGVVLGGYDATSQRLLGAGPAELLVMVARCAGRLWLPYFGGGIRAVWVAVTAGLLVAAPAVWLLVVRDTWAARRWLVGWLWLLSGLAPFGFEAMVPGNGRYGYLAAAGAALVVAAPLAAAAVPGPRRTLRRATPWVAAAGLALIWTLLLGEHLRACARAANTADHIRRALLATEDATSDRPRFLTGYPYFVKAGNGDPAAQIFHYGLRDAVNPPFSPRGADVLPLPPLTGEELVPVAQGAGGDRVWEWTPGGELRPVRIAAAAALVELRVEAAPAGADGPAALVRLPSTSRRRFRLLVSAPINGAVFEVPSPPAGGTLLRVEMPRDFLHTNAVLYGPTTVYWWVEGRDETGALQSYTRLRPLPASLPPAVR